jgi:glycerate kinase
VKIVLAPDSFKGNLRSPTVCAALARGIHDADPDAEVISVPMADGGEGTTESVAAATGGTLRFVTVEGPLGHPCQAKYALLPDGTAVAEMASASGIELIRKEDLNPLLASTFGTGELLRAMLDAGATRVILGIGGSATVDGGAGMAQALGYRLLDGEGQDLPRGGEPLRRLALVLDDRVHPRLRTCPIQVACDVTNPLLGDTGAVRVFGPQKGATKDMFSTLEAGLARLAEAWRSQGMLSDEAPGDGAAGGLGAGLRAFCGAELTSGAKLVADAVGLDIALDGADLVITGEGCSDHSTAFGKLPAYVAGRARQRGIPTILVSGGLRDAGIALEEAFSAVFPICRDAMPLTDAMALAEEDLQRMARNIVRLLRCAAVGQAFRR